jgi:hypothetical protein
MKRPGSSPYHLRARCPGHALAGAGWAPVVLERTSATYGPWLRSLSRNPA